MCRRKSGRSSICQPHGGEATAVTFIFTMATENSQEHFWGCELTRDSPSVTWTFEEEDDDSDFLVHTLFLKHGVLGTSAVKNERNVIQIETKNFDKQDVKMPFISLTLGQSDMCNVDLSFSHDVPVTFKLVEGSGPVCLAGQHLIEFPPEEYFTQEESAIEDELSEEGEESPKKGKKRKAGKQPAAKSKKGKKEESMSSVDDEEDEEDEDEEDEDEEEEDEEESMEEDEEEEEKKKAKKGKVDAKKGKKGLKATKASPKRAAKKAAGKKGKK